MPTTHDIALHVQGQLTGPGDLSITSMDTLSAATASQITFIRDPSQAAGWATSQAAAAIVGPQVVLEPGPGKAIIRVPNADIAVARLLELLAPEPVHPAAGIHPSAVLAADAQLGQNVRIGAQCFIGNGVRLGDGCILHPHVTLMDHVILGDDCEIYPGVVIRERCTIGRRCILHANVVIGAEGFGFRPSPDGKSIIKIPQIGTVILGNDVEIGAGSCVDRAKFAATVIGDFTKIDNQCQIAHNCIIGKCCVIAGQTGLSGSVVVEDGVMFGGKVAVKDQLRIGAGAMLAACAMVMNDVPAGAVWGGSPAQDLRMTLREVAAIRKLPDVLKTLRKNSKP